MSTRVCLPSHLCSSPGPAVLWGAPESGLSPSPGWVSSSMPLAPSAAMGMPPPQAGRGPWLPVHQLQGKGRRRWGARTCQAPPSLSDPEHVHGHCQGEAWSLDGEGSHQRGCGGARRGVEEFHLYSQHTLGISGGRGALGHSPSMKGNQTVNGSVGILLPLSLSAGVSPWKPLAL